MNGTAAANSTVAKFGWPQTLVAEYDHWLVLLRPSQPTLGSLVLAAKSGATFFGGLPAGAHAELAVVTPAIELALSGFCAFERINYLMLMMVDPHVHFHVIPRYAGEREWQGRKFVDAGWPKLPDLGQAIVLDNEEVEALVERLKKTW